MNTKDKNLFPVKLIFSFVRKAVIRAKKTTSSMEWEYEGLLAVGLRWGKKIFDKVAREFFPKRLPKGVSHRDAWGKGIPG